jgi:TolB-like protein/Flp pilus assembly protein TadD
MFTDIVGYTAMAQSDEAQSLEVLERHNRLLRPLFPKYKGREVKTIGDSFLVEFDSALDATNCAIEIQKFLHDYNISSKTDNWKIKLRIGVHLGDVVLRKGDVFGDAVNIASRIEPLAEPEGICISQQVFDQVHNKIAYPLEQLDHSELKGVKFPTIVYKILLPWETKRRLQEPIGRNNPSIAVLPFANMSPDPNDEYFADGMTEEIISSLSKLNELDVISRTSVMQYKKNPGKGARDIGHELNVGTLLEGAVRKAGNRLSISVKLIDIETDRHLWSENYERDLEDIFKIQSEIAESVDDALKIRLLMIQKTKTIKPSTKNVEAHILYLKGLASASKGTREGIEKSIEYYQQAIDKDPRYALAYAAISDSFLRLGFWELRPSKEVFPKAKLFAEKALQIDSTLAEAHLCLGSVIRNLEWDYTAAEDEFRRVIELNPSLAEARSRLAILLMQAGRFEEAIEEARRTLELDPMSADASSSAGAVYLYARRYDEAIALLENATELDSNMRNSVHNLGLALVQKGFVEEGIKQIERASNMSESKNPVDMMELAYAYSKAGKIEGARKILSKLTKGWNENPGWSGAIAGVYASLGENDNAIEWKERANEEQSGFLKAHLRVDFVFDPLRSDARFQGLLNKIGWAK